MADNPFKNLPSSLVSKVVEQLVQVEAPGELRRYKPGQLTDGPVLVQSVTGGSVADLAAVVKRLGAEVITAPNATDKFGGLLVDARDAKSPADMDGLRVLFAGAMRQLKRNSRVLIIGRTPDGKDAATDAAQYGLTGFVQSVAKELRGGATANLVFAGPDDSVEAVVAFFLSGRSAYVDGQWLEIGATSGSLVGAIGEVADKITGKVPVVVDYEKPLAGKVAVVTGAARGIGAEIASVLARDGAKVVCADLGVMSEALADTAAKVGGVALEVDVTAPDAGEVMHKFVQKQFKTGIDVLVHNAGITRDKMLANMKEAQWASVMAVNLESQLRINEYLLSAKGGLNPGARVVAIASIAGVLGNRGQTNYALSKAGVIGMVKSSAGKFAAKGATINAIAPGFIITEMTGKVPFATREVGQRMNTLVQGGLPVDVAETVSFLSWPSAGGINGQAIRVCGQMRM